MCSRFESLTFVLTDKQKMRQWTAIEKDFSVREKQEKKSAAESVHEIRFEEESTAENVKGFVLHVPWAVAEILTRRLR